MKRADELPVEPLSDAAWQRIERGVFEELNRAPRLETAHVRPRRRRIVMLLAGAAALQIAAAFAFFWIRVPGGDPATLASTRLVTDQQASEALLGDVSVQVEPASALVVVENARAGSLVVLERGAARFSVPPREHRPAFVVQAGEVRVEVVGTRFRVEREAGSARVEAYEGTVRVVAHGRVELLHRGASWAEGAHAAPQREPDATGLAREPGAAEPSPGKASSESATPGGRAIASALPARSPDAASDAPAGAGAHFDRARSSAGAARSRPRSLAQTRGEGASAADAAQVARAPGAASSSGRDRDEQRFEQAASLEASAPRRALELYGGLVAEGGRWGEPALYAMARLELELGERANALRLLRRYLVQHPRGANAADVRALVMQLSGAAE